MSSIVYHCMHFSVHRLHNVVIYEALAISSKTFTKCTSLFKCSLTCSDINSLYTIVKFHSVYNISLKENSKSVHMYNNMSILNIFLIFS